MASVARPVGVTVVAVLSVLVGVLQIVGGIAQLAGLGAAAPGALTTTGIVYLILGVATVAVGVGVLRGNRVARIVAAVVFGIGLLSDLVTLFVAPGQLVIAMVGAAIRVVALVLLFTPAANAYFRR